MSAKPWITPSEAEKVAKKVAEEVVKEVQPGGSSVVANPELSGDEDTLTGLEVNGVKYLVEGGDEIKINDWDTPPTDIVSRIAVNNTNYQVESHDGAFELYVNINTERSLISVDEKSLPQPSGYFFCKIFYIIDGGDPLSFFGYVEVIEQETLNIYTDSGNDFCSTLEYDTDNAWYATNDLPFYPPNVRTDLAQYLTETTGESIPVEEVHDLWIPQENRFVKFAGGSGSLYVHNLFFYASVASESRWYCLQYKSFSSERNVVQPTFASELCDIQSGDYIWHQWNEHDAHLYYATVEIAEDPPSTIKANNELTVLRALAPNESQLQISFVENGETKDLTIMNIDTRHQVYEVIQPAYIRPEDATYYWPYE